MVALLRLALVAVDDGNTRQRHGVKVLAEAEKPESCRAAFKKVLIDYYAAGLLYNMTIKHRTSCTVRLGMVG